MEANMVLGIDIGGSHISLALVDLAEKKLIESSHYRRPCDAQAACDAIMDAWVAVIQEAYGKAGDAPKRIGIALPGPFDYENGISYIKGNNKFDALYGINVKRALADKLGIDSADIRMLNDAAAFLQGEAFGGAARGYKKAIGITLGTGLGSAVCSNGIATDAERWSAPFKDARTEDYISTRWCMQRYAELTGNTVAGVKELSLLAKESAAARQVFAEFSENLFLFLRVFVADTDPEMIVLGGNITKAASLFLPGLIAFLQENGVSIPVRVSGLGEQAAILGAASCWQ